MKRCIITSAEQTSNDADVSIARTAEYLSELRPEIEAMFKEFPEVHIVEYAQSEIGWFDLLHEVRGSLRIYFNYNTIKRDYVILFYDDLSYNISTDVSKLRSDLIRDISKWDAKQLMYDSDPSWFDAYIKAFYIENVEIHDRRSVCTLTLYLKKTGKKVVVKHKCPVDESILLDMLDNAKLQIDQYFEARQAKLDNKANLRALGKQLYVPQGAVIKMIRDEFGISPSFSYRDTGKIEYMLYTLPFTDINTGELDRDAGEEFRAEFEAFLDEIESKYGLLIDARLPLSGSRIRAAFTLNVYGGPDLIYDKATKQWSIAEEQ